MGEIVISGNAATQGGQAAPGNLYEADLTIDLTPVKKLAYVFKVRAHSVNAASQKLIFSDRAQNTGFNNIRLLTNALGDLRLALRTDATNNEATVVSSANTTNINYIAAIGDISDTATAANRYLRYYVNGVQTNEYTDAGTAWRFPRVIRLTVEGYPTEGMDWSVYEILVWARDAEGDMPTAAHLLSHAGGTVAESLPVPPDYIWRANGTNGQYAADIESSEDGYDLSHIQGPVSGARAPIFLGETLLDLNAGEITVTSRTAEVAYTNNVTGTARWIVGPTASNATSPTGAQIKAGLNQNGTAALFAVNNLVGTTGAKTREFTSLTPSQSLRIFGTVETATDVFSNVISFSLITPRIGVITPQIYAPTNPRTLWASQTGINIKCSADGLSDHEVENASTESDGTASVDLSGVSAWDLAEGEMIEVRGKKGGYAFVMDLPIVNLDD